uniref:V-type proton ATPase subunit a n=1 Tax=Meloidogyne javanica TaxID=6303 RepID=A0A915MLS7_MELJA
MLKEQERQSVLNERIVPLPELESSGEDELQRISKEFAESVIRLEREKYDLSYTVRQKDFEINELTIAVNDLRGKLFGIFKKKLF